MFTKEALNEISNDLFYLLIFLNGRLINRSLVMKGLTIPPSNMKVIFYLTTHGSCPVSKIANDLVISKPNMTPVIDNLIAEGYVNRYDDPKDRRIIIIEPTQKAHDFVEQKKRESKELLIEKLSSLSDKDLQFLKDVIPKLSAVMNKIK
ncbi:MAG: transcriptional regulator, MarR family [Eubacterium sp.]|nr:transcriptional regulator, MarR family [Eubacterium sp.]